MSPWSVCWIGTFNFVIVGNPRINLTAVIDDAYTLRNFVFLKEFTVNSLYHINSEATVYHRRSSLKIMRGKRFVEIKNWHLTIERKCRGLSFIVLYQENLSCQMDFFWQMSRWCDQSNILLNNLRIVSNSDACSSSFLFFRVKIHNGLNMLSTLFHPLFSYIDLLLGCCVGNLGQNLETLNEQTEFQEERSTI